MPPARAAPAACCPHPRLSAVTHLAVALATLCAVAGFAAAQSTEPARCEAWAGEPASCQPYLRFHRDPRSTRMPVYIPQGYTQARLAEEALLLLPPVLSIAPAACRKAHTQLICLSFFLECADKHLKIGNTTVVLPRFVCWPACESANANCADLSDYEPVDCSQLDPFTGTPLFPRNETESFQGIACFADAAYPPRVPLATCPQTFQYSRKDDMCLPACPEAYSGLSSSDRRRLSIMTLACACVGFAFALLILPPLVAMKDKRRFPNNATTWVIGLLGVTTLQAIAYGVDFESIGCSDNVTLAEDDVICGIIGSYIFECIGGCMICWLLNLSINIFMAVYMPAHRAHTALHVLEYVIGFVPFHVVWALSAATRNTGPDIDLQICSIDSTDFVLVYLIISTVVYACTLLLMVASFVGLVRAKVSVQTSLDRTILAVAECWRMLATLVTVFVSYTAELITYWWAYHNTDGYYDALVERALCYAAGQSSCHAEPIVPVGLLTVRIFFTYLSPIPMFILLVGRSEALKTYKSILSGTALTPSTT